MNIETLRNQIEQARESVLNHPIYSEVKTADDLRLFTEAHVYAVWDFMSMLKALQNTLTCTTTPWIPVSTGKTRYLINEIVKDEECDVDENGNRTSHYEMYLAAMREIGADTSNIEKLVLSIANGRAIEEILPQISSVAIRNFLSFTFDLIQEGKPHKIAAAFTFGREDLIPEMFTRLVKDLEEKGELKAPKLLYYLERHIEIDGGEHSHLALEMIQELCGMDGQKWSEATDAAISALEHRALLWTSITNRISKERSISIV
jgi:hypothetical protein